METVVKNDEIKKWNDKPIYGIGLSDGQGGESFQMIPIGTPLSELVITANPPYGNKIKWNKPNAGGGGGYQGKQRSGNESFALSYAKDYAVAKVTNGKEFKGEDILKLADLFYNWLEKKKGITQLSAQLAEAIGRPKYPEKPTEEVSLGSRNIDSDLPF